jgi:RNA polymerase sigma-B factor
MHRYERDERRARTADLLRRAHRRSHAQRQPLLDEAVCLNMEVARSIARPYLHHGVATDDLHQVAYAALVRAVAHFEPDRAEDFLTYAVPSIRGEIRRHFRDVGWSVRPPRRVQEIQTRVFDARDRLSRDRAHPTAAEIADDIGAPEADVREALTADGCFTPASLDRPILSDGTTTVGELIGDDADEYATAEAAMIVRPALEELDEHDRAIIRMRFWDDMTQKEIGDRIGVTQMQVSRRISRIVEALREVVIGEDEVPRSA